MALSFRQNKPSAASRLSGNSSIADWLNHPIGGEIFREVLKEAGNDVSILKPVKRMPLKKLIEMSGGQFSDEIIDEMVRKVEAPTASVGPSAVATPTGSAVSPTTVKLAATPVEVETKKAVSPVAAGSRTPVASSAPVPVPAKDASQEPEYDVPDWQEKITPHRFRNKTIVVTGAGSGIGWAVASRIAREGGRVIAVDSNKDRLFEFKHSVPRTEVEAIVADITNEKDVARIVKRAGRIIDGLANVAGIMDNFTPVHEVTDEIWNNVMNVNVTGMMRVSRAVLPNMLAHSAGTIVNVGSEASFKGSPAGAAYIASKHAVAGLTKSMAFMYGASGIRVNMVAPGAVATNIQAKFASKLGQQRVTPILGTIPAPVEADQLAAVITFLLSDDSVNMNGAMIASDGGWSVQ